MAVIGYQCSHAVLNQARTIRYGVPRSFLTQFSRHFIPHRPLFLGQVLSRNNVFRKDDDGMLSIRMGSDHFHFSAIHLSINEQFVPYPTQWLIFCSAGCTDNDHASGYIKETIAIPSVVLPLSTQHLLLPVPVQSLSLLFMYAFPPVT